MIRSKLSLLFLSISFSIWMVSVSVGRTTVDLNPGWRFIRQDIAQAEQNQFDDSGWQLIDLPHTWNNLDGQDGGNNYYRGIGWYRLHLKTDPGWTDKALYLKFDAASIKASVFVNGKLVGTHAGSFGAFCFEITPLMHHAGDNDIAVKVDNAKDPNIAPLSGDFTVFGGIYRSVHLIVTNPLSISPIHYASSGVSVQQDEVNADVAHLSITTVVRDTAHKVKSLDMLYELLDAQGTVVLSDRNTSWLAVDAESSYCLQKLSLAHPHLWNGRKDPYLYTMRVTVLDGKTVSDVVEQPVGLRFFRVDPEKGFILNGQPYRLLGMNRHQDHLDKGWAVSLADHQLDFANMMEMGCTAVRLSHYQHAQEFYDLCDRGGIVAWAEIPIVNQVTNSPEFDDNASQQLSELITQSFNHPAICFWSLSNELGNAGFKGAVLVDQQKHQIELQTRLNAEAKQMDPTRLTTEAISQKPGKPLDDITDVIAFNRYFGWYGGKPSALAAELDKFHTTYPNRGVGLSEFGAGAAIRQHEMDVKQPKPGGKWHPEEWQALIHEQAWAAIKPRQWIWGTFIWAEHDFAADQRKEGEHDGRNDKGMVTYDGKTKKDTFYFYKANWSTEPMVYITDRRFSPRPFADMPIKIYSNCEAADLKLNGVSLGSMAGNDEHIFIWPKAQLKPGENTLEAIGTREGKQFTDSCSIVFDMHATDGHPPATKRAP